MRELSGMIHPITNSPCVPSQPLGALCDLPDAKGTDGTKYVVFASIPTSGQALAAESAMFQPLRSYGFEISPSPNS
jgi:hypothetical protein